MCSSDLFIRVLTVDSEGNIYAGTFDGGVFRSLLEHIMWEGLR